MSMIIATLHVANIRIPAQDVSDFVEDMDMFIPPTINRRIALCMDCGMHSKWCGLDICMDCFDRRNASDWE